MAAFKPTFVISDKKILWNLHVAAVEKLKRKFPKIKVIPLDKKDSVDDAKPNGDFEIRAVDNTAFKDKEDDSLQNKDGKYEVYVIYMPQTRIQDNLGKPATVDKKVIESVKKDALPILVEYFRVFCGSALAKGLNVADFEEAEEHGNNAYSNIEGTQFAALKIDYTIGMKAQG